MLDQVRSLVLVACLLATGCADPDDLVGTNHECRAGEDLHPTSGTLGVDSSDFTSQKRFFVEWETPETVHLVACGTDDFGTWWWGDIYLGVATTTTLPAPFEAGNPDAASAGAFFMRCPRGDCLSSERRSYNYSAIDRAELDGVLEVFDTATGHVRGNVSIRQILDDPELEGTTNIVADFTFTPHEPR